MNDTKILFRGHKPTNKKPYYCSFTVAKGRKQDRRSQEVPWFWATGIIWAKRYFGSDDTRSWAIFVAATWQRRFKNIRYLPSPAILWQQKKSHPTNNCVLFINPNTSYQKSISADTLLGDRSWCCCSSSGSSWARLPGQWYRCAASHGTVAYQTPYSSRTVHLHEVCSKNCTCRAEKIKCVEYCASCGQNPFNDHSQLDSD